MKKKISLAFTEDELAEVWAVMEYARLESFYGDPIQEPWNCEDRKAFMSAFEKVSDVRKTHGLK